jgi:hypothetical protein
VLQDHPDYYGKGFRGKNIPESSMTSDQKKQVVIEEITSDDENAQGSRNQFETESGESTGKEQAAVVELVTDPQPRKLLPPPRRSMQPVEVSCCFHSLVYPGCTVL